MSRCAHSRRSTRQPVAGCGGHYDADRVCTAKTKFGCMRWESKWPEDNESSFEKFHEENARKAALERGESYAPEQRKGESMREYFSRWHEESDRQAAWKKGEKYSPPQRSGESFDHWSKRSSSESSPPR